MRLLIVEDEPSIVNFVRQGLTEKGYAVDIAWDGREGQDYTLAADYDAYILDIMLPKMSGLDLLRKLRQRGDKTPTIMLTARHRVDERVQGLDAGADDYLTKPFAFPELLARIRALLRRPPLQNGTILKVANIRMDTAQHTVKRNGRFLNLRPREYAILEYFMRHPNQVLTRNQIGEHVWNFDFVSESNVVDVYIGYIRRKLEKVGEAQLIETVRGIGYRLLDTNTDV